MSRMCSPRRHLRTTGRGSIQRQMCLIILFERCCCRHLFSFRPQSVEGSTIDLDPRFPFSWVGGCVGALPGSHSISIRAALLFSALPCPSNQHQKAETAFQTHRYVCRRNKNGSRRHRRHLCPKVSTSKNRTIMELGTALAVVAFADQCLRCVQTVT
jgi:hypothetical protein